MRQTGEGGFARIDFAAVQVLIYTLPQLRTVKRLIYGLQRAFGISLGTETFGFTLDHT